MAKIFLNSIEKWGMFLSFMSCMLLFVACFVTRVWIVNLKIWIHILEVKYSVAECLRKRKNCSCITILQSKLKICDYSLVIQKEYLLRILWHCNSITYTLIYYNSDQYINKKVTQHYNHELGVAANAINMHFVIYFSYF